MKYASYMAIQSSDDLLLDAVKSYLESKVEKSNEFMDKLSDNVDSELEETDEFSDYNLSYELDGSVYSIDPNEYAVNFSNDVESYETTVNGEVINVNVDSVLDQLSNSVKVNRVTTEALSVLKDSGDENPSALITSFTSRIGIKVGDVSDNIQTMASSYVDIITTKGLSTGDRVKRILQYIGLYNVNTNNDAPDIGIPSSQLTDITGANVYQAWFTGAPKTIGQFFKWLVDTVKKIFKLMEGILQVVVGSNVFRTIKKFFNTLTLTADSFAYNSGGEDGSTIGDYGFSGKITGLQLDYDWFYGSDDILSIANSIFGFLSAHSYEPYDNIADCVHDLRTAIESSNWNVIDISKYIKIISYNNNGETAIPSWTNMGVEGTIGDDVLYLYKTLSAKITGWRLNDSSLPEGYVYECLNYVFNTILDCYHLNDTLGVTSHLYSNIYTRFDLPGSSLYFWLVGNDVYFTRRVNPITYYKDFNSFLDIHEAIRAGYGIKWHLSIPLQLECNFDAVQAYFDKLRSVSDSYAETDVQMSKSVWAANVLDAYYLAILSRIDATGAQFDEDIPKIDGLLAFQMAYDNAFKVLTGKTSSAYYSAYNSLGNGSISNSTLSAMLGASQSISKHDLNDGDASVFKPIFKAMNNEDAFFPFAHCEHIPNGRYHIITDYELGHTFTVFIETVIVAAAAIFLLKTACKMKTKAAYYSTTADAQAWDKVTSGNFTIADAKLQRKMQRKAAKCEKMSQAIFGSIPKAVNYAASSVTNVISATVGSLRSAISGHSAGSEVTYDTSLNEILKIIAG